MTRKIIPKKSRIHKSKQKKRKNTTRKKNKKIRKTERKTKKSKGKKRGAGPACSRSQVIEDNESEISETQNIDDPIVAEQMPDNQPLPQGAQRIPAIQYPTASAERVPAVPIATTEISLNTNDTPKLRARKYNSKLYNTKLNKNAADSLYNLIYESGKIEHTPELEEETIDALMNYVYHVKYFDPFSAQNNGNRKNIGNERALYYQLYSLIGAWDKYDGNIENLLWTLRSDPDEEIGF